LFFVFLDWLLLGLRVLEEGECRVFGFGMEERLSVLILLRTIADILLRISAGRDERDEFI